MRRFVLIIVLTSACAGGSSEVTPPPVVSLPPAAVLPPVVPPQSLSACALTCEVGAPCAILDGDLSYACTRDGSTRLQCRAGTFQVASTCKGPKGCTAASGKAVCDDDIGDVGDLCVQAPTDANYACSTDFSQEIKCDDGGRFQAWKSCRGPKRCHIDNARVFCDQSVAREGDRCAPVDNHSCSESDGTFELKCSPQLAWFRLRGCPKNGCGIKNEYGVLRVSVD